MFKKLFDKFVTGRYVLVALAVMIFALSAILCFFSTDLGAVAYEKFFRGNVLHWGVIHVTEDVVVYAHKTGNAGAKNEIQGLPKVKLVTLSTMTNGTAETVNYLDDTPVSADAIQWTEVDAGTAVLLTDDTDYYKIGATSLKIALTASAVSGDGAGGAAGADDDLEDNESIGFWIYSTENLAAGDFAIWLIDATSDPDVSFDVGAVVKGIWTWVEVDISTIAGGDADIVTSIQFLMSAAGATNLAAVNVYLDGMYKWDADAEETLGNNIITDGVLSVMTVLDGQGSANRMLALTEYTDYFTHTQTGNDAVVPITDQSTYAGIALIAYQ